LSDDFHASETCTATEADRRTEASGTQMWLSAAADV